MMQISTNKFKQLIQSARPLYGIFNGLVDGYAAEICAGSGFDWILIDSEHAPFDVKTILHQLQAVSSYDVPVLVRPTVGDVALIKQLMDIGAQTLLVPMIESAEQASQMVQAMRYPPEGIRGVGAGMARAAKWGRVENYMQKANDEMCLIVQIESVEGMKHLDEIAQVKGVDGVLIGPSDLSASMGFLGQPTNPEVDKVIKDALKRIRAFGKAAGVMATIPSFVKDYVEVGANIIVVGVDSMLLEEAARKLASFYKET